MIQQRWRHVCWNESTRLPSLPAVAPSTDGRCWCHMEQVTHHKENQMIRKGLPKTLRWIFFSLSIGTLVAAGIYLGGALSRESPAQPLRAVMFLLLGTFFLLMYGENRPDSGGRDAPAEDPDREGRET